MARISKNTIPRLIILLLLILIVLVIAYYLKQANIKKEADIKKNMQNGNNDAYLINLDSRKDRLNTVTNHFKNHLNIIKTSAVHMTEDIKKEKYPNVNLSIGQLGCGLSHLNIVKTAVEKNLKTVLILEDDCKPTKFFSNWFLIKNWLDSNLDKWDIFVGGNCKYFWDKDDKKETIGPICSLNAETKLYYTKIMCFQFIYLNSRAYKKFLKWEDIMDNAIDNWPDKMNMIGVSCTPFIAIQEVSYSDISKSNSDSVHTFTDSEKEIASVQNNLVCF